MIIKHEGHGTAYHQESDTSIKPMSNVLRLNLYFHISSVDEERARRRRTRTRTRRTRRRRKDMFTSTRGPSGKICQFYTDQWVLWVPLKTFVTFYDFLNFFI